MTALRADPLRMSTRPTRGPSRRVASALVALVAFGLVTSVRPLATGATASAAEGATSSYVPVGPLRLSDTRQDDCGCRRLDARTVRVQVSGRKDVPSGAVAAAVTVTAIPNGRHGFVTAYPAATSRPPTSTVNADPARVVANSAVIPLSADGAIDVYALEPTDVVIDLAGLFVPNDAARAGRFQPVIPARLLDTRTSSGPLAPRGEITVALPAGVPADATALAVNVTSVNALAPGYLSSRPAGTPANGPTSFLNPDGSGAAVASSVILPVSRRGLTLHSLSGGDVVVDVTGWFTGPTAASSSEGLFVPAGPSRVLDTRQAGSRIHSGGTIEVASPFPSAAAIVANVTATLPDWTGYMTAFPAGTARPPTSTVNAAYRDHTIANQALVPVSTRGVAIYASSGTDVVVDVTGWFTGTPRAATREPAPNAPITPRLLLVGDSALAVLDVYRDARAPLSKTTLRLELEPCRRLVHRSCLSDTTFRVPSTALEAIRSTTGPFDIAYVDAGHNDWFDDDFAWQFDVIVNALRAKGTKVILWATYTTDGVRSSQATAAYHWNNALLRHLTSLPQYHDVLLADWARYSAGHPDWFDDDGTHMTHPGAYAVADFIARWAAAALRSPCPAPRSPGGTIPSRCPVPAPPNGPADPFALYR